MTEMNYGVDGSGYPCSDAYGSPLQPPCPTCRESARRDSIRDMLDRECPWEQIVKYIEEFPKLDVEWPSMPIGEGRKHS